MSSPPPDARRPDGSMGLLLELTRAEDPAYADAARRAGGTPRHPSLLRGALVVGLVGLLTGTAAAAVRSTAEAGDVREGLVQEVQRRTADSDALTRSASGLREDVALRRDAALADDAAGRARSERLEALELAAATVAVRGPGIVVELDDRPADAPDDAPALPRGGQSSDGRVLDRDLQELVNGLWAAGAEAISINDLRLTVRTAIRSAGEAVLVDFRPLRPPYVVRAIGEPGRLEPAFVDGPAGRRLATYASVYGLGFSVRGEDELALPAGSVPELRAAAPS